MVLVKHPAHPKGRFYFHVLLKSNLDYTKKAVKKNWDFIFLTDGYEGSGKSCLTLQMAYICDPTFNIERVVFTPEQFEKAVIDAKKYQAIVYDEAFSGLSSASTLSEINRRLCGMLTRIRKKNLFIFIVAPVVFDITKYVAIHRSRALIHTYTQEGLKRGYFSLYDYYKKKKLYLWGKKEYNYNIKLIRPDFFGDFENFWTVDEKEYDEKKTVSEEAQSHSLIPKYKQQRNAVITAMYQNGITPKVIQEGMETYCEHPLKENAIYKIIEGIKKK